MRLLDCGESKMNNHRSMSNPKISIVTVSFNVADTIEKTILSVLNQTYDNIEYIIIDGGSTDGTVDIIKKYTDKIAYWVSEQDQGIYDAMNKGLKIATGNYINFMNAGDSFYDDSTIYDFTQNICSETVIAYGDTYACLISGHQMKMVPTNLSGLNRGMVFCHQSCFILTDYHKRHFFNPQFKIVGDYNFFYNAYYEDRVKFQYIPLLISNFQFGGISSKNDMKILYEKFTIWGIENKLIKKIPYIIKEYIRIWRRLLKFLVPSSFRIKHLEKALNGSFK